MTGVPTITPDLAELKSPMKSTWMAGDFGQIANFTAQEAGDFVRRIGIPPGVSVLDVACGTGNTAIPAAKAGASVTGVDIATNLLAQAQKRAKSEQLEIRFEEGDAEDLPYEDHAFDVVLTMFGAMFAPRPERVAAELIRGCKPGGIIAMANWTPQGFVGKSFQITSQMVPPPPVSPPVLWGDESVVRQRLGNLTTSVTCTRQNARFAYPFTPREVVDFFRVTSALRRCRFPDWMQPDRRPWQRSWNHSGWSTTWQATERPSSTRNISRSARVARRAGSW
jgi:SAM-dependent methyltransferase